MSRPAAVETFAAVDLGSNSFHMIAARRTAEELVVFDRLREMVQLARGMGDARRLRKKAKERALDCLDRFGQRIRHMPDSHVRVVGTNTLRSARNADRFVDEAEKRLGHPIETISGIEEARLVYLGVSTSLAGTGGERLVLDIGGGSTETIVGIDHTPLKMESLYMGCVTMSERHFADGNVTKKAWDRARTYALQEFEPVGPRMRDASRSESIGSSGTVRAVHAALESQGWADRGIPVKGLRRLRDALIEDGLDAPALKRLNERRREVIPGGLAILDAAFDAFGIEHMRVADGALREGLLHDLVGRSGALDVRDPSVRALAERYHVDEAQATRVERSALALFDQARVPWKLPDDETRRLLAWAARLHEIGLDIARAHYHRHGEYVVANTDLQGFSRELQRRLALLIRAHRRKLPVELWSGYPRKAARTLERLAVLLRLAVVLHRSRAPESIEPPSLRVDKHTIELTFAEGWLADRPLTRADLEVEASRLDSAGYTLTFDGLAPSARPATSG